MRYLFLIVIFIWSCNAADNHKENLQLNDGLDTNKTGVELVVLGTVQDGGSPHTGCTKPCCAELFDNPNIERMVVSLGLIDYENEKTYLIEASPDLPRQMKKLFHRSPFSKSQTPDGVFVTHAHIGHYTGLMFLGREVLNAQKVPVYAMPRMKSFLETNGPWNQLVDLENIKINSLHHDTTIQLSNQLSITPFRVPHRDEYSETVGFKITGPNKSVLFIPDINKWNIWDKKIEEEVQQVDLAFLDATFYDQSEIPHRNMSEIPHPFVVESMKRFEGLTKKDKQKIHFIHFNHTNPVLNEKSEQTKIVQQSGFGIARTNQYFSL